MTSGSGGRPNGWKAQDFIDVIPGTGGVITVIAERVGCAWHTAKKYITEYPTIKQAYNNEKHKVDDKAISNVYLAISKGDLETSKWWIRMKLGDEFHPTDKQIADVTIVNWDDDNQN